MHPSVYILAIAAFVVGTVELMIGGILHLISADLNTSLSATGQLITIYSLVFAISSPVLLVMTAKFERKRLYLWMMGIFLLGNLLAVISQTFGSLLLSRIILAASAALITVLSLSIAATIVQPAYQGRAIGMISMGISGSLVLGVPIGIVIGAQFGWRTTFLLISLLTLIALIMIVKMLPKVPATPILSFRQQMAVIRSGKIITAHLLNVFMLAGHLCLYAYFTPFLQHTMQADDWTISIIYFVFGLAAVSGGGVGGYLVDRWSPQKTILGIIILFMSIMALLPLTTWSFLTFFPVMMLWGMLSWAISPALQHYLIQSAKHTADVQLSLNTSTSHLGIALGSAVGGLVIQHATIVYNAWTGAVLVFVSLLCGIYSITRPMDGAEKKEANEAHVRQHNLSLND